MNLASKFQNIKIIQFFVNGQLVFDVQGDPEVNYLEGNLCIRIECDKPDDWVYEFDNIKIYKLRLN